MAVSWAVTPDKIEAAIRRIVAAGHPRKIIVFGSAAHADGAAPNDLDLLVVVADDVSSVRKESVRLRRALLGIVMPVDMLVVRESDFGALADRPGLIYREAVREGKIVYEASA